MPIPGSPPLSLYEQHVRKWLNCTRCPLKEGRVKVCIARGTLPAQIAFVGEAPGEAENVIGTPFIGPSGKLMDHIISQAIPKEFTWVLFNIVGCIPREEGHEGKLTAPPIEAILACRPKLKEALELANPGLVVCVGAVAKTWVRNHFRTAEEEWKDVRLSGHTLLTDLIHPAAILKIPSSVQQGFAVKRSIIALAKACENILPF
jgi:DNA polymerase